MEADISMEPLAHDCTDRALIRDVRCPVQAIGVTGEDTILQIMLEPFPMETFTSSYLSFNHICSSDIKIQYRSLGHFNHM